MTIRNQHETWIESFQDPSLCRTSKPRSSGITMVMDKGLGLIQFKDLLHASAEYIDFIKLGFGSSILYPAAILEEKIKVAADYQISIYPGGTFFEIAYMQGKLKEYLSMMKSLGFQTLEISDGTITLPREERNQVITEASEWGFQVITECGKKLAGTSLELEEVLMTLRADLRYGAHYMIIEGRESGTNVGFYDPDGRIDDQVLQACKEDIGEEYVNQLIWEAPQKEQQASLIQHMGTNVNLGNISSDDILSVEALRRGLRSDTLPYMEKKV